MLGMSFAEITHPDYVNVDLRLSKALFAGEIPYFRINKLWIRKDGTILQGLLAATVLAVDDAPPMGFAAIMPLNYSPETVLGHEMRNLLMVMSGHTEYLELENPNIEHVGGMLRLESEEGQGTLVELVIPKAR